MWDAVVPSRSLLSEQTNVGGSLAASSRIVLDVELDLLSLLKGVELARRERRMMKEDLGPVIGANEAEPTVTDETHNRSTCHGLSLPCEALSKRASTRATGGVIVDML